MCCVKCSLFHEREKITIRVLGELAMGQETHHKQSASFGTNFDKPFPDEAINCTTPHLAECCPCCGGGQIGNRVPKWINRDLIINCMIGILNSGVRAPITASFIS